MKDNTKIIKLKKSQALVLKYTRDDIDCILSVWKEVLRQNVVLEVTKQNRVEDAEDLRIRLDILIRKKDTLNALFTDDEYECYDLRYDILKQDPALADLGSLVCFSEIIDWCLDCEEKRLFPQAEGMSYRDRFFPGWRMINVCKKLIEELFVKFN